jgi:hypothetical protein
MAALVLQTRANSAPHSPIRSFHPSRKFAGRCNLSERVVLHHEAALVAEASRQEAILVGAKINTKAARMFRR